MSTNTRRASQSHMKSQPGGAAQHEDPNKVIEALKRELKTANATVERLKETNKDLSKKLDRNHGVSNTAYIELQEMGRREEIVTSYTNETAELAADVASMMEDTHKMMVLNETRAESVWFHHHIRCAAALGCRLGEQATQRNTKRKENERYTRRFRNSFYWCIDAMLRENALVVSGGGSNKILCLKSPSLEDRYNFGTGQSGREPNTVGDVRGLAAVQYQGRPAVAFLEDKFKHIRIVSCMSWERILNMVPLPDKGLVHSLVALRDPEYVAVSNCTSAKAVFIIHLASEKMIHKISVKRVLGWWPTGLLALPDGNLAVADYNGGVEIVDPLEGRSVLYVRTSKKAKFNATKSVSEAAAGLKTKDAALNCDYPDFRPSRLGIVPRRTVDEVTGAFSVTYDLILGDDDYAKAFWRVTYPGFESISSHGIKHLYQAECGGMIPLPEARPPFHERIAVLNHGANGAVRIISEDPVLNAEPLIERLPAGLKNPLGLALLPLPDVPGQSKRE